MGEGVYNVVPKSHFEARFLLNILKMTNSGHFLFKQKLYNLGSREKPLNPIVIIYVEPTVPLLAVGN